MNKKAVWIGALGLLMLLSACNIRRVDLAKRENVPLGDAESARVVINMGVGQLNLNGGAEDLLAAGFRYNVELWEPEIAYEVRGRIGQLSVSQPDDEFAGIPDNDIRNEWDLRLNDDIPTDLDVNLGVGETELKLSGLTLTDLNINTGVGEVTVDLSGDWSQSFDVTISGGVGETTLILPQEVGVLVKTETGIGSLNANGLIRNGDTYTNEAYGESDVTITIDIGGGIGNINLEVTE
jgi:hypothetical protein